LNNTSNPEYHREYHKKWREQNRTKVREYKRLWRIKHLNSINEQNKFTVTVESTSRWHHDSILNDILAELDATT